MSRDMNRELNRVMASVLAAFAVIALAGVFWAVFQGPSLLARDDNARNVIAEQRIRRGTIYAQNGARLAFSQEDAAGLMRRVYPYPAAVGAVGYYSLTYGVAGIEAEYDALLRGDGLRSDWKTWWDDLLHRPPRGGDVRATLDLGMQLAAAEALGDQHGAVIAVEVPSGRVLALVSQPGYDPNMLDRDWPRLTRNKRTSPLLNRVTAGLYQPGGALQTVMLAAILATYPDLNDVAGMVLNTEIPTARDPVTINGLTLTCLDGTPDHPLTLAEAYVFGCPAPFVAAPGQMVMPGQVWERFEALGLLTAPALAGFDTAKSAAPQPLDEATSPDRLRAAAAGQDDLTVTPLQMVQAIAAIANRGNGVPLHLVDAMRKPDATEWEPVEVPDTRPALLRADVAATVRLAMLQAAAQNPIVSRARRGNQVLYGHAAVAYAGPQANPYAWFTGFVDQTEGEALAAIVVVVVVENEPDPARAADVAGAVFQAARE